VDKPESSTTLLKIQAITVLRLSISLVVVHVRNRKTVAVVLRTFRRVDRVGWLGFVRHTV
jgi:hypothetical protein